MSEIHRVTVVGGGSFGTAIANICADNGHDVRLWMRSKERALEVNDHHLNSEYLPDIQLNPALRAEVDITRAVEGADTVFVSVPSKSCREVARQLQPLLSKSCRVVSTTKGIEPAGFKLMSEILREELPENPIGVLSGPNLAKELAGRRITATVIASQDSELTDTVQALLQSGYFRAYAGSDVYGVELAGALKNVYAIVCGMAAALDTGTNALGLLLTRSIAEMVRFAVTKGADPMTFMGLSGMGDLVVTCTSPLSRNYRVGFALGEGRQLEEVVGQLGQVAEGVNTLRLLKAEADRLDVYMPLCTGLYAIIYGGESIDAVVQRMMTSEQSRDVEFSLQ